jgi:hypothetical protein
MLTGAFVLAELAVSTDAGTIASAPTGSARVTSTYAATGVSSTSSVATRPGTPQSLAVRMGQDPQLVTLGETNTRRIAALLNTHLQPLHSKRHKKYTPYTRYNGPAGWRKLRSVLEMWEGGFSMTNEQRDRAVDLAAGDHWRLREDCSTLCCHVHSHKTRNQSTRACHRRQREGGGACVTCTTDKARGDQQRRGPLAGLITSGMSGALERQPTSANFLSLSSTFLFSLNCREVSHVGKSLT